MSWSGRPRFWAGYLPSALIVRATLMALGAALVWDDRHDWPFPIRDRIA